LSGANSIQIPPEQPRNRTGPNALKRGIGGRLGEGWRLARRIFHVLVGLTFFVFATAGATVALEEWRAYREAPPNGVWRFAAIAGFSTLLLIFGLYSILKARSVR